MAKKNSPTNTDPEPTVDQLRDAATARVQNPDHRWVPTRPKTITSYTPKSRGADAPSRTRAVARSEARTSVLPQVRVDDRLAAEFAAYLTEHNLSAADAIRGFIEEGLANHTTTSSTNRPQKGNP